MARSLLALIVTLGLCAGAVTAMGVELDLGLGHGRICLVRQTMPC